MDQTVRSRARKVAPEAAGGRSRRTRPRERQCEELLEAARGSSRRSPRSTCARPGDHSLATSQGSHAPPHGSASSHTRSGSRKCHQMSVRGRQDRSVMYGGTRRAPCEKRAPWPFQFSLLCLSGFLRFLAVTGENNGPADPLTAAIRWPWRLRSSQWATGAMTSSGYL